MKAEWNITGSGLPELKIEADSFDDAIAKARMIDKRYCGGQIVEKSNTAESRERGMSMEKTLREIVESIDKVNAEYILRNAEILEEYRWLERYKSQGKDDTSKFVEERLIEKIKEYDSTHLTPANAKVGDGATINLWSDRHACTIIKVTKTTVTVQRDTAILNPDFKPEFIPGGFVGHCINQSEQSYTYERDEQGTIETIHWSEKHQRYGRPGFTTLSKGRHEFYDYNF